MMSAGHPPPGWYADPTDLGSARWWDGRQWTQHVQRLAPPPPQRRIDDRATPGRPPETAAAMVDASLGPHARSAWWRRKWALLPVAVVLMIIAGSALVDAPDLDESAVDVIDAGSGRDDEQLNHFSASPDGDGTTPPDPATTSSTPATTTTTTTTTTTSTSEASTSSTVPDEVSTTASTAALSNSVTSATAPPSSTATTAPSTTVAPSSTQPPTTRASTATQSTSTTSGCHPAYRPCLPHHPGDALNCGDLPSSLKPVTVIDVGVDPYGLDADSDGVGCESG